MTEMIERVAKAIYLEFENRPDYAQLQMNGVIAEELARAAIEAMREPTEAMLEAAFKTHNAQHLTAASYKKPWQAVIDKLLEDKKEKQ